MGKDVRVIVPYARNRIAYAVLQSLGGRAECHAADSISLAMCRFSRKSKGFFKYPQREGDFVLWAKEKLAEGYLIFPTFSESWVLRQHREFAGVLPRKEIIDRANSKWEVHLACREAGIPSPDTYCFEDCVVKPETGRGSAGRQYLHDVVVQERVFGPSTGVGMLFSGGKLKAKCCWRRCVELPADGGWSVVCKTISSPWHENASEILMDTLQWREGPCMVEWKGSHVIEVNPRFWGSLGLSIEAGVDFPKLMLDILRHGDCEEVCTWKTGVVASYVAGCVMRRVRPRGRFMDLRWRDPAPFLAQFGTALSNMAMGRGITLDSRRSNASIS